MGLESGSGISKEGSSSSSSRNEYPQSSDGDQESQIGYAPPPPQEDYDGGHAAQARRLDKFPRIADHYTSLDQVTNALANAGLESSNLIFGIDFTRSNKWTGTRSFNGKSLHHIGDILNPYEQTISIIGRTLSAFDKDNLIPCFGFGDASTRDRDVFSFYPDERCCNGFVGVLSRYREIVHHLQLADFMAGPTSFAPIVEMAMNIVEQRGAMNIVEQSGDKYHVLVIIADGQVTSQQEQKTLDAIAEASKFPLSIILVGVGDEPWDTMKDFVNNIPARAFDNFQFVNFAEIMSKSAAVSREEIEFVVAALMEIPSQYRATKELNLWRNHTSKSPLRFPLPPPVFGTSSCSSSTCLEPSLPPAPPSTYDNQICIICHADPKEVAFDCGHQTCCKCEKRLEQCPICRIQISRRIRFLDSTSFNSEPSLPGLESTSVNSAPPALPSTYVNQVCSMCLSNPKDMVFNCGHRICCECGIEFEICPNCTSPIETKIKLF